MVDFEIGGGITTCIVNSDVATSGAGLVVLGVPWVPSEGFCCSLCGVSALRGTFGKRRGQDSIIVVDSELAASCDELGIVGVA